MGRIRTRRRSCKACSAAKVRCSFEQKCSRCLKKDIDCVYDSGFVGRQEIVHVAPDYTILLEQSQSFFNDSWNPPSIACAQVNCNIGQSPNWCTWANMTITLTTTTHDFPTVLSQSEMVQTSQQKAAANAVLILQSLRSLPNTMLRRQTFPFFIHGHSYPVALPEPLTNCMGVAQMFVSRTTETRAILWRTILTELQNLQDQVLTILICGRL